MLKTWIKHNETIHIFHLFPDELKISFGDMVSSSLKYKLFGKSQFWIAIAQWEKTPYPGKDPRFFGKSSLENELSFSKYVLIFACQKS